MLLVSQKSDRSRLRGEFWTHFLRDVQWWAGTGVSQEKADSSDPAHETLPWPQEGSLESWFFPPGVAPLYTAVGASWYAFLVGTVPTSGIAGWQVVLLLSFSKCCQFSKVLTLLCSPTSSMWEFHLLYILANTKVLWILSIVAILVGAKWYVMGFFKKIALLRYNLWIIKCTHFKQTVKCVLTNVYSSITSNISKIENTSITLKFPVAFCSWLPAPTQDPFNPDRSIMPFWYLFDI